MIISERFVGFYQSSEYFFGGGGGGEVQERVILEIPCPTQSIITFTHPLFFFYETCVNDLRPSPFEYFQENNFLTKYQPGFGKFHPTVTSMLKVTNDWLLNMDKGLYTGVVYFDLKKAFDMVDQAFYYRSYQDMG